MPWLYDRKSTDDVLAENRYLLRNPEIGRFNLRDKFSGIVTPRSSASQICRHWLSARASVVQTRKERDYHFMTYQAVRVTDRLEMIQPGIRSLLDQYKYYKI